MQKPKINFKKQSGMTIILSLLAVLILSIIAASLLRSQNTATRAYNQFYDVEVAKDATDFCIAEAFDKLQQFSVAETLTSNANYDLINPQITNNLNSTSTSDCQSYISTPRTVGNSSKIVCAFLDSFLVSGNDGVGITNKRISDQTKILPLTTCKYEYMTGYDSVTSSSTGEISSSRNYGTSSSRPIKYYRVTAVKDTGYARVEYQVILGI
jgi:type II secretory pathway pseudopilin PulG